MKRKFGLKVLISPEFCSFSLIKKMDWLDRWFFWFLCKFFWHAYYLHYVVIVYNVNWYSVWGILFEPFCAFQFMFYLDCWSVTESVCAPLFLTYWFRFFLFFNCFLGFASEVKLESYCSDYDQSWHKKAYSDSSPIQCRPIGAKLKSIRVESFINYCVNPEENNYCNQWVGSH